MIDTLRERVIVFDFETSGLSCDKNQPIEVAAKSLEVDGTIKEFQCLVKCPEPLHPKIIEITSITDDMLSADGIPYEQAFDQLASFMGLYDENSSPYLVGHNWLRFDAGFLKKGMTAIGITLPEAKGWDTAGQYKAELMGMKRMQNEKILKFHMRVLNTYAKGVYYNLTAACKQYSLPLLDAHRAMGDVEATLLCYLCQVDKVSETEFLKKYLNGKHVNAPEDAGQNEDKQQPAAQPADREGEVHSVEANAGPDVNDGV